MVPDLASEQELELLRAEGLRALRVGVPAALFFVCIFAVCLVEQSAWWPIAAFNSLMALCQNLFQLWVYLAPGLEESKARSRRRAPLHTLLTSLGYCLNIAFEDEGNRELMQSLRHVVLPLVSACELRDEARPELLAAPLLLLSGAESAHLLFAQGAAQRCLVNLMTQALVLVLMRGRADLMADREALASVCGTFRRLLGALCDGYCVLDEGGAVLGADKKLLSMLGEEVRGQRLESFAEGAGLSSSEGLQHARLCLRGGEVRGVDVYSVLGEFTAESLREVLGHWCAGAERGVQGRLCVLRESGEVGSSVQAGEPEVLWREGALGSDEEDRDELVPPSEADRLSEAPSARQELLGFGSFFPSMQLLGIGVGEYRRVANVYHRGNTAVWQVQGPSGEAYAMKEVKLPGLLWRRDFPKNLVRADRELRSMKRFQWASSVVVRVVEGWLQEDMVLSIVMEWLPLTLRAVLEGRRTQEQGPPEEETVGRWTSQVAAGLAVIHTGGFMHRDLKTSNLLLTQDLQSCKIADFGLSRELHRTPLAAEARSTIAGSDDGASVLSGYTAGCGTKGYMSPEVKVGGNYGPATDIFSLGCVLLELLTLAVPDALRTAAMASELLDSQPLDRELAALCLQMLHDDFTQRPTALGLARAQALAPHVRSLLGSHPELHRVLGPGEGGEVSGALGVLRLDGHGLIVDWSSSLVATFGVPADLALGRSLAESFLPREGRRELPALARPVAQRLQEVATGPLTLQLPSGKQRLQATVRRHGSEAVLQGPGLQLELRPLPPSDPGCTDGLRQRSNVRG